MEVASSTAVKREEPVAPVVCCNATTEESPSESDYEDEQLKALEDQTGQNYFGSQSMLSQEIHAQGGGLSQESMMSFSQVSINSTATADVLDSQQMVHHYGLLAQDPAVRSTRTGGFAALLDTVSMFQSQEEEEEKEAEAEADKDKASEKATASANAVENKKDKNISKMPVIVESGNRSSAEEDSQPEWTSSEGKRLASLARKRKKMNGQGTNQSDTEESQPPASKKINLQPKKNTNASASANNNKSNTTSSTANSNDDSDGNNKKKNPPGPRKRKRKDDSELLKQQELANRAADLAQRTISDPELAKRLLLSMALTRENPRSAPEKLPGPGHVLPEGFFWAHYPPLEKVLKDNMAEYYELSITKCQSAQQQSFNNTLVELVRAESNRQRWLYADCFTDKNLRDRIRCYYKTHIQNAKKRLRTMVKNPTKRANARHLCSHLDMIEKNAATAATEAAASIDSAKNNVITHKDWGSDFAGDLARAEAKARADEKAGNVIGPQFEQRVASSVATATAARMQAEAEKAARLAGALFRPPQDNQSTKPLHDTKMPVAPPHRGGWPPMPPHATAVLPKQPHTVTPGPLVPPPSTSQKSDVAPNAVASGPIASSAPIAVKEEGAAKDHSAEAPTKESSTAVTDSVASTELAKTEVAANSDPDGGAVETSADGAKSSAMPTVAVKDEDGLESTPKTGVSESTTAISDSGAAAPANNTTEAPASPERAVTSPAPKDDATHPTDSSATPAKPLAPTSPPTDPMKQAAASTVPHRVSTDSTSTEKVKVEEEEEDSPLYL